MILKQVQAVLVSIAISTSAIAAQTQEPATAAASAPSGQDLQQLLAPIALYPDGLVAQVLAGSTYPTQVVDADRWVRQNQNLKGEQLAAAADKQPWDPSVKALIQFPSVLSNMSQNLSWTSALGDAYFNDPQGVLSAIQALRKDASNAGNLKSTQEQTVTTQGQTITIEPANPEVVYVPEYSPAVYGTPIESYPGYSGWGVAAASAISFGVGTAIGAAAGGWGWGHWGMNWGGGSVTFNRNNFVSRSNTFANSRYAANRANFANRANAGRNLAAQPGRAGNVYGNRAGGFAGSNAARSQAGQAFANRDRQGAAASRGFGQSGLASRGANSNAFSGVRQGGAARMDSARGRSSFSGGGRAGGGGGFRGGGGGRGGGGRR
jgi:hypothetical protein